MGLAAGTRLGAYEIVGLIGAGGMGEVYRAVDTRLDRHVAIKVLPEAVRADPERAARFEREAKLLATLNHPNIATIHGFEHANSEQFIVMELVEGQTLADRIGQGPMPLDETLAIARLITEALEAAHEQGVIHRDLKPANIKLREDGTVKVLDFGLAKLVDPAGAGVQTSGMGVTNSPTITTPAMTQLGVILGTAAYMSPEQAKGRPADKRSDIWAFGCVLYEMLTGKRAFDGEDVSDTLAAVLRADPDWTVLPANVSLSIRALVQRCLAKDRRQRIADVSIARYVMNEPAMAGLATTLAPPLSGQPSLWGRVGLVVVAAVAASALTGVAMRVVGRAPFTPPITRFALMLPEGQQFTGAFGNSIAISADGTQIVYVANSRLYVRLMPDFEARPIPGTETPQGISRPIFSPDGRSVAFYSVPDRTIKRIATEGGTAITVCQVESLPAGMTWTNDNILFGQARRGIMRVSSRGGRPEPLISVSDKGTLELLTGPQMLPGDQAVLFTVVAGGKAQVVVQSLASSERTLLTEGDNARYLTTGHIVYWRGGTVFGVSFDVGRLRMMGESAPLVPGVLQPTGASTAEFSVSDTGTLIYRPGPTTASSSHQSILVLVDRKGHEEALKTTPGSYESPRFSPDGKRVAVGTDDGNEANIWVYNLTGTTSIRQLTFGGRNRYPIWSADGERIAFQSDREGDPGIFWQRADGTDTAVRLTRADAGTSHIPESWSRTGTGERFSFSAIKSDTASLFTFSLDEKKSAPFGDVRSTTGLNSVFSPDGKWLAYTLRDPPRVTSQIQPFPPTGTPYRIADLAHHPMWSQDGKELFYLGSSPGLVKVSVALQPSPAFGIPVTLAGTEGFFAPYGETRSHDIAPDGNTFVRVGDATGTESGAPAAPQIRVVLNWMEELKQRLPTR